MDRVGPLSAGRGAGGDGPGDRAARRAGDPAAGRGARAHRQRELRVAGGAGGARVAAHEQVRRGAAREALLRRLRVRGPGRELAIDRAKQLFGADHANVQPHSGATANAAVFLAFLKPGDTFMGMDLSQGGHLTHGSPVNFSGLLYKAVHYGVNDDGFIDYDRMRALAHEHRPKMIIAGYSAYSRVLDFPLFAE